MVPIALPVRGIATLRPRLYTQRLLMRLSGVRHDREKTLGVCKLAASKILSVLKKLLLARRRDHENISGDFVCVYDLLSPRM